MARVESYTKEHIDKIERKVIVGGSVNSSGELELIDGSGNVVNGGNVQGDLPQRIEDLKDYQDTDAFKKEQVPAVATSLTEIQNEGRFSEIGAVADIIVAWVGPSVDVYGHPVQIANYHVYFDGAFHSVVSGTRVSFTKASGIKTKVRVVPVTTYDIVGDPSVEFEITANHPGVSDARPTLPTFKTGMGNAFAVWDGVYLGANLNGGEYAVLVKARKSGPWIEVGYLYAKGDIILPNFEVGDLIEVEFDAVDKLGHTTGSSGVATVTVNGINLADLDAEISAELTALDTKATNAQTAAGSAQSAADAANSAALAAAGLAGGKGEVIFSSSAPPAAKQLAQNLWIDTTGGANAPNRWSGSAWVVVTDKVATDAAATAATAQTRADAAFTNAATAATAAGNAQTTADGKNRVWYLGTAPAGTGHKKDDVWFDTANGMRMSFWNITTSTWQLAQFGTQAIANLAITNALIADATIQSAKIAALDAGKITTGFLAAARIAATSITVAKLAIGSFNEIWPDPEWLEPGYGSWTPTASVGIQKAGTGTQHGTYVNWADMPVSEGERYLFSIKRTDVAGSGGEANVYVQALDANKALLNTAKTVTTLTPGTFTGERLVPAGAAYLRVGFYTESNMGTGVTVRFSDLHIRQLQTGTLFVDGAVKARHVEMETGFFDKLFGNTASIGRVNVDHLAPNVGSTLNLGGNAVAINLNSRVDAAQVDIEHVQQATDSAQASANMAQTTANAAQQAVNALAAGRVLTAENALGVLSGKIDTYDNSFLFDSAGLHIRESKTASAEMLLTSAGARLIADGVTVSEWNQGQMIVPQIVATSGRIANHIIDSSVTGHTTFRAIS